MLGAALGARDEVYAALGISAKQLHELIAQGDAFSADLTGVSEGKGKEVARSPISAMEHLEQTKAAVDALAEEVEGVVISPFKPEDLKQASREIGTYIETGAMTESALAGPSTARRAQGFDTEWGADVMQQLSSILQHDSQEILADPAHASPGQRNAAVALTLSRELDIPGAREMYQAALIIAASQRSVSSAGSSAGSAVAQDASRSLTTMLKDGFSALIENKFKSPVATTAASVANASLRDTASVLLPTFLRQMLSALIEKGITESGMSDTGRAALGGAFAALPIMLLGLGAIRAHRNPAATAQEKREGDISRLIMGGMAFAALLGGIFSGQLADKKSGAAAQMIAFTLYTWMRDIAVQAQLRLKNPNMENPEPGAKPVPDKLHWAFMSVTYGIDQFAVNQLMPMAAPISGPGAYHAGLALKDQAVAAAKRAFINFGGEVAEDLLFNGFDAARKKQPLRLGLGWEPNATHVANGALAPWAVRTAITQTNVVFGDIIAKALGSKGESASTLANSALMGGGLNGFFYEPFATAGKGFPQVAAPGGETVNQQVFPNVDMDDSRSVREAGGARTSPAADIPLRTRTGDVEEGGTFARASRPGDNGGEA